jgi:hypothetical protein
MTPDKEKKQIVGYCIGSIHGCKDHTKAFDPSEKAIVDAGHIALNPIKEEKEKTGMECADTESALATLWSTGEFDEYRKLMKKVYARDLDNVRKADYLVLHFEEDDKTIGAAVEMTFASMVYLANLVKESCTEEEKAWITIGNVAYAKAGFKHKPIYWVCTGPMSSINSTLKFLVLSGSDVRVFKTYLSLTEFLKQEYNK